MSTTASELINKVYVFLYEKVHKNEDLSHTDISVLNQCFDVILNSIKR